MGIYCERWLTLKYVDITLNNSINLLCKGSIFTSLYLLQITLVSQRQQQCGLLSGKSYFFTTTWSVITYTEEGYVQAYFWGWSKYSIIAGALTDKWRLEKFWTDLSPSPRIIQITTEQALHLNLPSTHSNNNHIRRRMICFKKSCDLPRPFTYRFHTHC